MVFGWLPAILLARSAFGKIKTVNSYRRSLLRTKSKPFPCHSTHWGHYWRWAQPVMFICWIQRRAKRSLVFHTLISSMEFLSQETEKSWRPDHPEYFNSGIYRKFGASKLMISSELLVLVSSRILTRHNGPRFLEM